MNPKVIDTEKCIGCGKCVRDCITQFLTLTENNNGLPKASFKDRGRCIDCGHCNAICPQRAISGGRIEELIGSEDKLLRMMGTKRTVRHYIKGGMIPQQKLDCIVLAGQSAPTEKNRKSARMLLIKDNLRDIYNKALDWLVAEVERTGPINPNYAQTIAMDKNREEVLWNAEYLVAFVGLPASKIDASIASERMQLEAWSLGVGTGYRGDMKDAINNVVELRESLNIKKNEECLITFAMGLTPLKYLSTAIKTNRKVEFR